MFCRNCGNAIEPTAAVCLGCGVPVGRGVGYCPNCGEACHHEAVICVKCGAGLAPQTEIGAKSKLAAGLLGIFLGGFGVHNFYLGYTKKAIIQIIVSIVTCGIGALWGFIEGILIICGSTITRDAAGNPLVD